MYWRSVWSQSPAADLSARGIFYATAIVAKQVKMMSHLNELTTLAAVSEVEAARPSVQPPISRARISP
jgi:hypothetical protein